MHRWHFALAAILTGMLRGPVQAASVWYVGFSERPQSRAEEDSSGESLFSRLSRAPPIDVTAENQVVSAVFVDLAERPVLTAVSALLAHGRMVFYPPSNEGSVGIPTYCAFVFPLFPDKSYLGGAAMDAKPWSGGIPDQGRSPFLLKDDKNEPSGAPPGGDSGGGSGASGRDLPNATTSPGSDQPDTPTIVAPEPSALVALTGIALATAGMRRFRRRHMESTAAASLHIETAERPIGNIPVRSSPECCCTVGGHWSKR